MASGSRHKLFSWTAVVIMAAAFVALNVLAGALLNTRRIDLTEGKLYTVSQGTKNILSALKEPVTLRFFYSQEQANGYPALQSYATRLKGLLAQYQGLSDGKVKVEIIDPKTFSEEEDLAVALGIAGLSVDGSGDKLYFGLAASNTVGNHASIPFFDPDKAPYVEYDLTRLVHDLANSKKPKVGLMTWLPLQGGGGSMMDVQGPWIIYEQIRDSFDLQVLDKDAQRIPSDIDVLMIVHPDAQMPEDTKYAIDQYILHGGSALIFVDPYTKVEGALDTASNMPELFNAWGIEMPKDDVVADPEAAIRVRNDDRDSVLESVSNPVWLALQKQNFNAGEMLVSDMEMLRFIVSGRFEPKKPEEGKPASEITMTPLVLSGPNARTVETNNMLFNFDPSQFLSKSAALPQRAVMAARLSGVAHTAFPGKQDKDHLAVSEKPINVVVVADADMLRDGFWATRQEFAGRPIIIPTANNGAFVLNALDILSGGGDLIGLRSRMTADRPFEKVETMRMEAESRFRTQEDKLKRRLEDLERRLSALQQPDGSGSDESGELLSPAQQEELTRFREEMLTTRKELRDVQRALREDIEKLGSKVKLINIALMPLLVLLLALVVPGRLGMRRRG